MGGEARDGKIEPLPQWEQLCTENDSRQKDSDTETPYEVQFTAPEDFCCVEWQAGGFNMIQAAKDLNMVCQWIDPRHSRIARVINNLGYTEYSGGAIHL